MEIKVSVSKVKCIELLPDGVTAGTYNDKNILNLIIYEVELQHVQVKEYAENAINDSNILKQVKSDGFITILIKDIFTHQKDEAISLSKYEIYVFMRHGQR